MTHASTTHTLVRGRQHTKTSGKHGTIRVPWVGHIRFKRGEVRRWTQDCPICQQLGECQHGTGHPSFAWCGLVGIEYRCVQDLGDLGLVEVLRERLDVCRWWCGGGQRTREEVAAVAFSARPKGGDVGIYTITDAGRDIIEDVFSIGDDVPGNPQDLRCDCQVSSGYILNACHICVGKYGRCVRCTTEVFCDGEGRVQCQLW